MTEADELQILERSEQAALLWWFEATSTKELAEKAADAQLLTAAYSAQLSQLDQPITAATPDQLRLLSVTIAFIDVDFVVVEITLEAISTGGQQNRYFELVDGPDGWQIRSTQ